MKGTRSRPCVLVIDDEDAVLQMTRDILEDEGYRVLVASEGFEGLRLAERARPDVIITDLMMPGLNGRLLHERLRRTPATARIPVLLMSAAYKAQPGDRFAAIIPKPFDIDDLIGGVRRQIEKGSSPSGLSPVPFFR
jgi:CheY-like chemotaxis protein